MLRYLTLNDFVIVDALELEFAPGFNVLTGETGAGKSILVDALKLVIGARADSSVIRVGATRSAIAAEFEIDSHQALRAWLDEQGFDNAEDILLVRRVIEAGGRSRAFINGAAATLAQLAAVGRLLAEIHGQHEYQSLLRRDAQRDLLDAYAGLDADRAIVAQRFRAWRESAQALHEWQTQQTQIATELAELDNKLEILEPLKPVAGEWEALQAEHKRLANAAELQATSGAAEEGLDGEQGLRQALAAIATKIEALAEYDPAIADIATLLNNAHIELGEASQALRRYANGIEIDAARLNQTERRIEALFDMARRWRTTPELLPELLESWRARRRQRCEQADVNLLIEREAKARHDYDVVAEKLRAARKRAARKLATAVTASMQELAMEGGKFEVTCEAMEPNATGLDTIEFLIAPHPGSALAPLAKIASGGELARISLAIQVVSSAATRVPTLIFDEVDAGIGGGVAERVGVLLGQVAQNRQVLCVTHLPQVAAQAAQHYRVDKSSRDNATRATVTPLDRDARIAEIARMLGGIKITATTRAHAREMLGDR